MRADRADWGQTQESGLLVRYYFPAASTSTFIVFGVI